MFTEVVLVAPRIGAGDGMDCYRRMRLYWAFLLLIFVNFFQVLILYHWQRTENAYLRQEQDWVLDEYDLRRSWDSFRRGRERTLDEFW